MIKIRLMIEEEFIEEFMNSLPKDKVKVIEENFEENQVVLQETLDNYEIDNSSFAPLNETMNNLSQWLNEKEQ